MLTCQNVSKSFRSHRVLTSLDLQVESGEAIAVVGENGSGKSTLLQICAGVLAADSGEVQRADAIGYCPQIPGLMDLLTIDDHVKLIAAGCRSPRQATIRVHQLLEDLGLDRTLPMTAAQLSGGQRQKLNVALAMANNPGLVLLDEPYQGFDHGSYVDLWALIDQWTDEGRAVLIITHLLAEQERVTRTLTLRNGALT